MNPIERAFASGGDLLIKTVEARAEGEAVSLLFCQGFDDTTCTTEDGRTLTFAALAMEEALPKNDNSAYQSLDIALDNTMGDVQEIVEGYKKAGKRIDIIYREYLLSDLTYPSNVFYMTVLSREYSNNAARFTCGFFDLLNTIFNRDVLTTNIAPGIMFL